MSLNFDQLGRSFGLIYKTVETEPFSGYKRKNSETSPPSKKTRFEIKEEGEEEEEEEEEVKQQTEEEKEEKKPVLKSKKNPPKKSHNSKKKESTESSKAKIQSKINKK